MNEDALDLSANSSYEDEVEGSGASAHDDSGADSSPAFRRGARVAVDVGRVRVGVAACDSDGILPVPVATARRFKNDIPIVLRAVRERNAIEIYVGLPLNMDGSAGKAAAQTVKWAEKIAAKVAVPVRLIDERLTSVSAHQRLRESGLHEIDHRPYVDQEAAVIILQSALDQERLSSRLPGLSLDEAKRLVSEG